MLKSTCWSCPALLCHSRAFFHIMLKVAWVKVGAGLMSGYWQILRGTLLQAEIVRIPLLILHSMKTFGVFSNGPVNKHMLCTRCESEVLVSIIIHSFHTHRPPERKRRWSVDAVRVKVCSFTPKAAGRFTHSSKWKATLTHPPLRTDKRKMRLGSEILCLLWNCVCLKHLICCSYEFLNISIQFLILSEAVQTNVKNLFEILRYYSIYSVAEISIKTFHGRNQATFKPT